MPTSWNENTAAAPAFTENTAQAPAFTEATASSVSWLHGISKGRVDGFSLFGMPIPVDQSQAFDAPQTSWNEATLA